MSKVSMKMMSRDSSKFAKILGFLSSKHKKIIWEIYCWGKKLEKLAGWKEFKIYGLCLLNHYFCSWYLVSTNQPHRVKFGIATQKQSLKSVLSLKRVQVEKNHSLKVLALMTQKFSLRKRKKFQPLKKKLKHQKIQKELSKRNSRLKKRKNSYRIHLSLKRRRNQILLKTLCMSWRIPGMW